jgi:hypothetical protein
MLAGVLPLVVVEAFAGALVERHTTIFVVDDELGWRLRPGARDVWLGAEVEINHGGMRGESARDDGALRVLFLGDSVVFGAFIERDAETIPARTESFLRAEALQVQCLNAGVGGWAPWQERLWFEREGAGLGAEVVIIHIVLNDVTEPLVLVQRGGSEVGFQLDHAREPGWWQGTSWATAVRSWRRRARGEEERVAAARASALGVYEFLRTPSMPASRAAWTEHLTEVGALVDAIRSAGSRPVIVSHPYTVQFEVAALWWPQDEMAAWCGDRGVPHLDVGRYLESACEEPLDLYADGVHPNAEGAAMLGREIAGFLIREGLLN